MQKPSPPKGPFSVLFSAVRERLASPCGALYYSEIQKEQTEPPRVARARLSVFKRG